MNSSLAFEDTFFDEDLDESEFNPDVEQEIALLAASYPSEVRHIARDYMISFFKNKSFSEGGRIPTSLLLSNHNIMSVINYDIINGVKEAYSLLGQEEDSQESCDFPRDIKLVVHVLNELSEANIPQQFAGGMLLLYLKLVEGIGVV